MHVGAFVNKTLASPFPQVDGDCDVESVCVCVCVCVYLCLDLRVFVCVSVNKAAGTLILQVGW